MNRRTLIRRTAAGLLAAGAAGILQRVLAAGANPVPAGIHRLKGALAVNGRPAREGQLVGPGDTLATGGGAEAIYVIGQDAFLQREATTVEFAAEAMRVVTGRILSVFGQGKRRIVVPTATIGIRGTGCYIEAAELTTYFCLCYGEAEVVPARAPAEAEVIRTRHHDHPIYINADPRLPASLVPATVANHTDAELTLLESLVGRRPPFAGLGWREY